MKLFRSHFIRWPAQPAAILFLLMATLLILQNSHATAATNTTTKNIIEANSDHPPLNVPNGLTGKEWTQIQSQLPANALNSWNTQTKLTPDSSIPVRDHNRFGWSVSISGDTLIIGSWGDELAGADSGSAYVFTRNGGTWSIQALLNASDAAPNDNFGYSVSISGDTAIIGARGDNTPSLTDSGSAYVFTRTGGAWSQQAKLTANDAASFDDFGYAVGISGDTAVIGAYRDQNGGIATGSAYIFTRTAGVWSQQAKLLASDADAGDQFGGSVAINNGAVIIGAMRNDDDGSNSGSAYIFTRSRGAWNQQAKLTASDAATDDVFGKSVAISGSTAVIGAHGNDDAGSLSGSAYVFTRNGSIWSEQAKLTADDADADNWFGYAVAVDGDTAVIGAHKNDDAGGNSGSAYIFTRSGGIWSQQTKLTANDADAFDQFGYSVAINGDTVASGAWLDDVGGATDSGSVYVFEERICSAQSGAWETAATWVGGVVPSSSDGACIQNGHTVTLNGNATINQLWVYQGGILDLQTHDLSVETSVSNNGTLRQTQTVNNASVEFLHLQNITNSITQYRGVMVNATANTQNLGATTISVRELNSGEYCTSSGNASPVYAQRCYEVTPTTPPTGNVSLRLYARTADELNSIAPADLRVYHWNGALWAPQVGTTGSSGAYSYAEGDVGSFSPFLLGGTTAPTVVSGLQIQAHKPNHFFNETVASLATLMMAFGTLIILGKRYR